MPASIDEVVELLDLERIDDNLFRGHQPRVSALKRVFGGQVAAQAVVAAQRTVPADRTIHSIHCYFVLGGDPNIPIVYDVESVRDGRSFSTRRVKARQHGQDIFLMSASFQVDEDGWEHQDPMPVLPPPDEATPMVDLIGIFNPDGVQQWQDEWGSFDMRYVGDNRAADDGGRATTLVVQRMWFRAQGDLPADPRLHEAMFTYFSDFSLLGTALLPHGLLINSPKVVPASLDHVIWFHRPIKADDWLLYDQSSPSAQGARGLSTARVFTRDGHLVATVAQEGLIRRARRPQ